MDKFTVEEINLMCVFEGQDRMGDYFALGDPERNAVPLH